MGSLVEALRKSPQQQRFVAAAAVVVIVVASVVLWGRDGSAEPQAVVVAASQPWVRGLPPGEHVLVELPQRLASLFVSPDDLHGKVAAAQVPAGAVISPTMLAPADAAAESDLTLLRVRVDSSLWPAPGPQAGDVAVLSASAGGCSVATVALAAADDEAVVLRASPDLASLLAPDSWWAWQAPEAGWPACPTVFEVRDITEWPRAPETVDPAGTSSLSLGPGPLALAGSLPDSRGVSSPTAATTVLVEGLSLTTESPRRCC